MITMFVVLMRAMLPKLTVPTWFSGPRSV
ncbi:uncharacterized protein METZ01_LOCUS471521 [marine metagenome]|uniref:Uncharacterized protein n=1 Tax=marine metagenome TaxID=408172 RepID=A0A383BEW6_9ZZZZ